MKSKIDYNVFVNEMNSFQRYKPVKEEPMPKGFFSSRELASQCDIVHRVSQRWISQMMEMNALEVRFVRRKINGVFIKKIPVYKFKHKSDEKEFKSRLKRKR